jgi:1-phosphofructokinase/tagatose 6-phosphate kinase
LSVADRETRGLTEFYENGLEVPFSAWPELAHAVGQAISDAGWLTISGSIPKGIPPHGYGELVEMAHGSAVRVAVDSHGEALTAALSKSPELVKVNAAEAAESIGKSVRGASAAAAGAALELRAAGGGDGHAAIVTAGTEGAVLAAPDGSAWRGIVETKGSYPVGSGDSFLAGFVVALDAGSEWKDAFRLALGAAAANAEIPGAGRLERSRAESLAATAVLTEITAP